MRLLAGTSGFSYKEWLGSFYPEKLAAKQMLAYYATRLPAVEINNTFYRMPQAALLEAWRAAVPEAFRFAVKAPRRISHIKRLNDCEQELRYLLDTVGALASGLGSILVQLPPYLKRDLELLERFVEPLPPDAKVAFEFRNDSWLEDGVYDLLARRNLALVVSETGPDSRIDLPWTADWAYLRLRRPVYTDAALEAWLERLAQARLVEAQVFFKHEDEAAGPRMARRFLELNRGRVESTS
jgi:uncharacterized protein YecE (DUF72 family)